MSADPRFVRNSTATRKCTYAAFNEKHGSNAHAILQKFRSLQQMRSGQTHTVAKRQNEFNKASRKLVETVR